MVWAVDVCCACTVNALPPVECRTPPSVWFIDARLEHRNVQAISHQPSLARQPTYRGLLASAATHRGGARAHAARNPSCNTPLPHWLPLPRRLAQAVGHDLVHLAVPHQAAVAALHFDVFAMALATALNRDCPLDFFRDRGERDWPARIGPQALKPSPSLSRHSQSKRRSAALTCTAIPHCPNRQHLVCSVASV